MLRKIIQLFTLGALSVNLWANDISQDGLLEIMESDNKPLLIDVRSLSEYQKSHIQGAINIPHNEMAKQINTLGLDKNQSIILYCRSGYRARKAAKVLTKQGYTKLYHLDGDFLRWQENNRPVTSEH